MYCSLVTSTASFYVIDYRIDIACKDIGYVRVRLHELSLALVSLISTVTTIQVLQNSISLELLLPMVLTAIIWNLYRAF